MVRSSGSERRISSEPQTAARADEGGHAASRRDRSCARAPSWLTLACAVSSCLAWALCRSCPSIGSRVRSALWQRMPTSEVGWPSYRSFPGTGNGCGYPSISATALGCDTDGPVRPHTPDAPLSHAAITCTFGANGADVEAQITDQAECGPDQSALATFGLNWHPVSRLPAAGSKGIADGETMTLTCILDKGPSVMSVMDAGGAYYGNQIC